MHGLSMAQLPLNFGVDDLDGSVVEYKITHDADSYGTPNTMHREDLLDLIWDAGFRPVERNTRYEVVREYDAPTSAGRAPSRAAAGLGLSASQGPTSRSARRVLERAGPAESAGGAGGQTQPPSFGRSIGALWLYTILRFLVFGILFGLLWLVGVPAFLAAVLALFLSVPLSYVLLAKPRAALAETVEARLSARRARSEDLSSRLKGDDGNATP